MAKLQDYLLVDVDYGYCDECAEYEIVNTYKKPYTCQCEACLGRRLSEIKAICGKCLEISLTYGAK